MYYTEKGNCGCELLIEKLFFKKNENGLHLQTENTTFRP
jgi:hypothetical protein